ncbi:MAG: hypothetical protein AAGF20_00850 [Pseudomonadota bacterium]
MQEATSNIEPIHVGQRDKGPTCETCPYFQWQSIDQREPYSRHKAQVMAGLHLCKQAVTDHYVRPNNWCGQHPERDQHLIALRTLQDLIEQANDDAITLRVIQASTVQLQITPDPSTEGDSPPARPDKADG